MLTELHIENIAVIERADVTFAEGFNVLTGETGAGKSIVIDAIDAVIGGRVSRELVRTGAAGALVSAVFSAGSAAVASWCAENDITPEDELILQRRISADGKSACRVCGVPVTAQQLRSLGTLVLDIMGRTTGGSFWTRRGIRTIWTALPGSRRKRRRTLRPTGPTAGFGRRSNAFPWTSWKRPG